MINHNTILLVTPVLRTDNLQYIAKNIVKRFSEQNTYNPFWVICIDQYHADTSLLKIRKLEVYLLEHNIPYRIYYQGVEGDANYGGTLMNAPLLDIQNHYANGSNPWVYVLDDDNILSRNFFKFLNTYTSDTDVAWVMNMLDEFGSHRFSRSSDFLSGKSGTGINEGFYVIHPCASCDPSQLLIRLDKLLELEGFGNTRFYDYEFMNKCINNACNIGSIIKCQGTDPNIRNNDFFISCYHNGLVKENMINEVITDLSNDSTNDSYVRIHTKNHMFNVELTNDEIIEILQKHLQNEQEKTN
jgi:hypothetical protein